MLSSFFGALVASLGLWCGWIWRHDFVQFLKGCVAVSLFLSGVITIIIGLSTRRESPRTTLHKKDHEKT
jgi:hypothetical protein